MAEATKERSTRRLGLRRALALAVVAAILLFLGVPMSDDWVSSDGSITVRVTKLSRYGYVFGLLPPLSPLAAHCRMRVSVIDNASGESQLVAEHVRGDPWESYISNAHVIWDFWEDWGEFVVVYVEEGSEPEWPWAEGFRVDRGPPFVAELYFGPGVLSAESVERWIGDPYGR